MRFSLGLVLALTAANPAAAFDRVFGDAQATRFDGALVDLNVASAYYQNEDKPDIWIENGRPSVRARELVEAVEKVADDGLNPSDYLTPGMRTGSALGADADAYERAMSAAFLRLARDLHGGRTSPSVTASNIVIPRKTVSAEIWLPVVAEKGVETALKRLRPAHPQYYQLRQMLAGYRGLAERGGWPKVPAGATLKPGMNEPRVAAMRANLTARGYGGIGSSNPNSYDASLAQAVKHFQKRHGLDSDGFAGKGTIEAMNVSADKRVQQIIVNMERWRWLPQALGPRHVLVNQAAFELFLVANGKVADNRRVIVGKPFHQTPMFSDLIRYAEFNPTWTVTPAIAASEMLPKLRADPGYLGRNDYDLFAGWGPGAPLVDPWSVDWQAVSPKTFRYKIVQRPGPKNALGVVKFMFPNSFNIYLHDTPSRQLFAETGRAFSHGCIRVDKPLDFANKLFAPDGALTPAQIKTLASNTATKAVKLKTPVPVHLTYFTAWIGDDGAPSFFADIYGRDTLVARLLFGGV